MERTKQSGGLFVGKGRHGRKSRFPHQVKTKFDLVFIFLLLRKWSLPRGNRDRPQGRLSVFALKTILNRFLYARHFPHQQKEQTNRASLLMTALDSIEYDTYRQEKDIERFCVLCPLFLTSTASVSADTICRYASPCSARYICPAANSI